MDAELSEEGLAADETRRQAEPFGGVQMRVLGSAEDLDPVRRGSAQALTQRDAAAHLRAQAGRGVRTPLIPRAATTAWSVAGAFPEADCRW